MEKHKAPGPNGFPMEFYQTFWVILKMINLMNMFVKFQQGDLPLIKLNYGTIILPPKKENVVHIQQYRPICLLNVSFKKNTKVGTNHVTKVAHMVIYPTQTS
jgi:hypothetical protein